MRGTLLGSQHRAPAGGIIPAYAGNTNYGARAHLARGDHPRVGGEHLYVQHADWDDPGSSPRMRGTLSEVLEHAEHGGIIPAYAGNTATFGTARTTARDHPRVCGEHLAAARLARVPRGSSPRMRGTRTAHLSCRCNAGIIPAYAGNTGPGCRWGRRARDHPRVCGEHSRSMRLRV